MSRAKKQRLPIRSALAPTPLQRGSIGKKRLRRLLAGLNRAHKMTGVGRNPRRRGPL